MVSNERNVYRQETIRDSELRTAETRSSLQDGNTLSALSMFPPFRWAIRGDDKDCVVGIHREKQGTGWQLTWHILCANWQGESHNTALQRGDLESKKVSEISGDCLRTNCGKISYFCSFSGWNRLSWVTWLSAWNVFASNVQMVLHVLTFSFVLELCVCM